MAAYRIYRKLFEEPSNSTLVVDPCMPDCDPVLNPTGNCSPICTVFCPSNCNTTYSYPPPPAGEYDILTPSLPHHSTLSLPLKISLVILVFTFSFFLLYSFYKFYTVWYRSRRRDSSAAPSRHNGDQEDQETHDEFLDHDVLDHPIWYIRTIGLQPSVISAITVVKYNKLDGLVESTSCSVCLSEFQDDETLRLLPKCNHAFHVPCIDTWLRSHTNCPLCRAGIVKNTNTTNSDDLGQTEETHIAISITEDNEGETPREGNNNNNNQSSDLTLRVIDEVESNKREIIGGSGTNEFIIMRRSVSLNDYEACRIRSDIQSNNNYYSDRHNVQIQPVDGNLGFQVVKVDRAVNNRPVEH